MTDPEEKRFAYSMKTVVSETGLNPMTIRTWERRYGIPNPQRSAGGHRAYSRDDIETLKWLSAQVEAGIPIRDAVEMWHVQQASGRRGEELGLQLEPPTKSLTELRDNWLAACMAFSRIEAEEILEQAFAAYSPLDVVHDLLFEGIAEIGRGWVQNEITIQQEHFASALATRRLETLIAALPQPQNTKRVIIGCAPEDDHTLSPLLLTYSLLAEGWDVIYLGANVPVETIQPTVERLRPDLIIFSAQRLYTASTLLDIAVAMFQLKIRFGYGGNVFNYSPLLRQRIPGHFLGRSLKEAVQEVDRLLSETADVGEDAQAKIEPNTLTPALNQFVDRRMMIESHVWGVFAAENLPTTSLLQVNKDIAEAILAALKLGTLDLLGEDIAWIEHLLVGYRPERALLLVYLRTYTQAAKIHLSTGPAGIVCDWLSKIINNWVP